MQICSDCLLALCVGLVYARVLSLVQLVRLGCFPRCFEVHVRTWNCMSCIAHSTAGNSCRLLCQSSMFANSSFFSQRTSSFVCSVGFPAYSHQQLRRQVNISNGSASKFDTFRRSRDGARKIARSVGCSEMAVSIVSDVSCASPVSYSWSWNDMYWFTLNFGAALLEVLFQAHKSLLNSALGEAATVYIWTNCTLAPQGKSALCEQRADWTSDQRHGQCHLRDDDLRTRRARAAEYRRADFLPLLVERGSPQRVGNRVQGRSRGLLRNIQMHALVHTDCRCCLGFSLPLKRKVWPPSFRFRFFSGGIFVSSVCVFCGVRPSPVLT